jgi:uncharacterized protein (DUF427 family)
MEDVELDKKSSAPDMIVSSENRRHSETSIPPSNFVVESIINVAYLWRTTVSTVCGNM